ncbi:MFS transporter [Methylobacterium sp. P31]
MIFSTFFFGYALFAFVGGQLADRYGPRSVYSWAAASWSVLCMLTGAVTGFAQMFVVRALFGFAEGPMNSTTNRTITTWFPREETARTIGFTFSGQTVGSAIAAPVVGLLAIQYGWRVAFVAIGAVGLIWVVVWRLLMTDRPQDNPRVGPEEIALVERSRAVTHLAPSDHARSLREYLFLPSTLSLGLGMFAVNYTLYIFLSWLPSYLTDALHMPVQQMALVASIPWACGFVGYVGGGVVADHLYTRMGDKLAARKLTTIVPLAIAGVALIAVNAAPNPAAAVALIALAVLMLTRLGAILLGHDPRAGAGSAGRRGQRLRPPAEQHLRHRRTDRDRSRRAVSRRLRQRLRHRRPDRRRGRRCDGDLRAPSPCPGGGPYPERGQGRLIPA